LANQAPIFSFLENVAEMQLPGLALGVCREIGEEKRNCTHERYSLRFLRQDRCSECSAAQEFLRGAGKMKLASGMVNA
jgi:hypothetical protein